MRASGSFLLAAALAACSGRAATRDSDFADVSALEPGIRLDIRYATKENFTGRVLYPVARCLLRPAAARRLVRVHRKLSARGYGLKVWDCYRPLSIQRALWELVPDPRYVADPAQGSRHNRGAAVDATLVDSLGRELEMPTGYDDFSAKAHRSADASPAARENSRLLEDAMREEGFLGLPTEWWHFDAEDWRSYPVADEPLAP